ncbi:MAG TPA: NBR1-Ig-like domain-containing protein [Anaerolineales bacterium]|nr:NBR1-Ig-like domain-containing protein [Anaerolineales bacterium]
MRTPILRPASLCCLVVLLALLSTGCNFSNRSAATTPTQNSTQSFLTAVARVTQYFEQTVSAGEGSPTEGPTGTPTATPGLGTSSATPGTATAVSTAVSTVVPTSATPVCDRATPGDPIDVTIPDGTDMLPGQAFVKTWRLVNSGTCTWTSAYAVVWVSGDKLGDQNAVALTGNVGPGQSVDISVPMTAPVQTGSYQSNWQLRNAGGDLFGIGAGGQSVFWVRIDVVSPTGTPTATATATLAATAAPSATPTPVVHSNGTVTLALNDAIDLDSLQVNGGGTDLSYALDGDGNHLLTPAGGAVLGVYGASKPGLANCQATSMGGAALAVESVGVGTFLCYRTGESRLGYFQVSSLDPDTGAVVLIIVTWANP